MNRETHSRAGKTLIELLVVIATASTVLTVAGQLLFRVSRTERAVREAGTISRAELRLIRDLRADVRAATSVEATATDDAQHLHLVLGDDEIDYRATDEGIERTSTTRRELYRLGAVETRFRTDDRFVFVEVEPRRSTPGFPHAAAERFRITAAIGADSHDRQASPAASGPDDANASTMQPVEALLPEGREP
jgi:type II secretory pathway pseudopilin PulG